MDAINIPLDLRKKYIFWMNYSNFNMTDNGHIRTSDNGHIDELDRTTDTLQPRHHGIQ